MIEYHMLQHFKMLLWLSRNEQVVRSNRISSSKKKSLKVGS